MGKKQNSKQLTPEMAPIRRGKMSLADAMTVAEDLPDGAYFALVEELSGYDPVAMAPYCAFETKEGE